MHKLSLITLLFIATTALFSQGKISGTVSSEGKPLEFVNIGLLNTKLGTSSNEQGKFEIKNIPNGTYELIFSILGYENLKKQIIVNNNDQTFDIELKTSTDMMEEVVVSGTMKEVSKLASPVPVEVYTKKFFRANPSPSIFESLQNVNGVRPQVNCNVCNTGDIHINGLEGPYTMVLIDGMPIVSGLSTVYGLTGIPQSLIERIEIVKGPSSTLYGSEAVGGLINIITKKPSNSPLFFGELYSTSWQEVNTDLGMKFKLGKAHSIIGVNYFNYNNPIDNNGDGFTDITLQDRLSIFNKWSFDRKDNKITSFAARYVTEDRWGGEMNWTPEYRGSDIIYGESIWTDRIELFGTYQLPVKENIQLQFSANRHEQNSVYGDSWYIANQMIGFSQLTWNKQIGPRHDLMTGLAYRYTDYDDNTPATADTNGNNQKSVIHLPGVFIQDEFVMNEQSKLLMGLRIDNNSNHGFIYSPRLNYKWNSRDKKNILRISAGNGFRVANVFTEDHAALTGAREVIFEGELAPETSWNINLNYVKKIYTNKSTYIGLDGTIFYTYFTNRIVPDYETNPNQIIYANLEGNAISQGASLNIDISTKSGLKILLGSTLMDVSITENDITERQILTERISGVWSASYTLKKSQIKFDYTGNLYGPMRLPILGELDNRPEYSPSWSIQNIKISKTFTNGLETYISVKNLLNYTPPANSIARAFDPFDRGVDFADDGSVIPSANNPNALTFDPAYMFAPNQGIRAVIGLSYTIN